MVFEIRCLVLDGFEVCEYIGEESDEEDDYHVLLSLKRGKYSTSKVGRLIKLKYCSDYEYIESLWILNKERMLNVLDEIYEVINQFCSEIEVNEDFKIFGTDDSLIYIQDVKNSGEDYFSKKYIEVLTIDAYQLKKSKDYIKMMKEYILKLIQEYTKINF